MAAPLLSVAGGIAGGELVCSAAMVVEEK